MSRALRVNRWRGVLWAAGLGIALAGCAASNKAPGRSVNASAAAPDSATVLLWHFDESGGTRVIDAGPLHLEGVAGVDTRTDFGRFRSARQFSRSIDSFVYLPYLPAIETGAALSVEAWLQPTEYGPYEMTPIIGRWTPQQSDQSWMFALAGRNTPTQFASLPSPGYLRSLLGVAQPGQLIFAFQPEDAGSPLTFASSSVIEPNRWTHVAVTFDGELVKFFVDAQLDVQFATRGRIRRTRAPLLAANYFDWRWLSGFGGDLRVTGGADRNPYYAYPGFIDELQISNVARPGFDHARYRFERGK